MSDDMKPVRGKDWIEDILKRLDFVEWDRFVTGDDPNEGRYVNVYGWIEREGDGYKDFVLIRCFPDTEGNVVAFTTSSDRYTHEIHRRIYGTGPDDHNDCRRVEYTFDVPNAIELHEDTNGDDS